MMQDPVGSIIIRIRASDYTNDWEILTVRAGDGVDYTQATDGEGDDTGADATSTGVAVGCVAGVKLVAAADVVELGLGDQVVQESEVEVAGDTEDVAHADLDKPVSYVASERGFRRQRHRRRLDCRNASVVGRANVVARRLTRVHWTNLRVHL